ncbi:zinc finger BED domain-containing protein DAYSLEEPER-like [Canna indica]|uniref:Zinc finger BED domain-containing protein DAYSLEEPER-like n=1 Tax=Canna indica TaxID=4628 RepID=A0AAQ3KYC0_9LILI|nr:zinc finger BED domain-containing protein DAYSLEEPER-like [Canna indica]
MASLNRDHGSDSDGNASPFHEISCTSKRRSIGNQLTQASSSPSECFSYSIERTIKELATLIIKFGESFKLAEDLNLEYFVQQALQPQHQRVPRKSSNIKSTRRTAKCQRQSKTENFQVNLPIMCNW